MDFIETGFQLVSTALALYFSYVRFRARMPLFGHSMMAAAIFQLVFSLMNLDLLSNVFAATFVLLYMKSLTIIQQHGLSDGSLS
jgi:hypothetical protein